MSDKSPSPQPAFDLSGKIALITGGNRGLGFAIADALAGAGAKIVIAARDDQTAGECIAKLRGQGTDCIFVQTDVAQEESRSRCVEAAVAHFGSLHILVNNAGISIRKLPEQLSLEDWESVIAVNLTAPFALARLAYPHIKRAGGGKIINIGSLYSTFGAPMVAPYAASKGGVVQLTRALATAWAKDAIQVNALIPGWHDTDLTARARQDVAGLEERVVGRTPAGRWGTPDDIRGAAVFLASSASDFVTGASVVVDGGFSVQG
ncbi:MAG TPA: glucose 1-dehydrogenase [Rhizomicrobium sp.]|jgi:2-deoxy-D-gluconate 3-dehydrogenase|nr:glucose 1-dehydrogenase [Rhizomicrobium sp.]